MYVVLFQFLVNTPDIPSRRCSDKPVFVYPTPPESEILVLKPGETLYVGFYATSPGTMYVCSDINSQIYTN